MEIVTKTAINEIMLSDQSTNEKAYKIASQVEWVDGLSKGTVTEALILVLQAVAAELPSSVCQQCGHDFVEYCSECEYIR